VTKPGNKTYLTHRPGKWFWMQDQWKCWNVWWMFLVFTIPCYKQDKERFWQFS